MSAVRDQQKAAQYWSTQTGKQIRWQICSRELTNDLGFSVVETAAASVTSLKRQCIQLSSRLLEALDPTQPYFENQDYASVNCLASPGTVVYLPQEIGLEETRLRKYQHVIEEVLSEYLLAIRQ